MLETVILYGLYGCIGLCVTIGSLVYAHRNGEYMIQEVIEGEAGFISLQIYFVAIVIGTFWVITLPFGILFLCIRSTVRWIVKDDTGDPQ